MDITMNNSSAVVEQLLQSTHEEALDRNEVQADKWKAYAQENEELCSRLLLLRDKLKHSVMVPVGKKALFRGELVHTNEILVSLGDGWFAKKSAVEAVDVCKRKMKECDEMLERLKKERDLLVSRKTFPMHNDVFGGRDEIIEPFNEEEEKKWREKHKESLKRYRRELKAQRDRQKAEEEKNKDCSKDIFNILDSLECQEDIDDELNRLVEDEDQARFVEKHVKQELNRRKAVAKEEEEEKRDRRLDCSSVPSSTESNVLRSIENLNVNERSSSSNRFVDDDDVYDFEEEDDDDDEEEEEEEEDDDDDDDDDDDGIVFCDENFPSSQQNFDSVLPNSVDCLKRESCAPRKKKKSVQFHSDTDKLNEVHIFHSDNNKTSLDELPAAVIHFKHSANAVSEVSSGDEPIKSPSDVYRCFPNCRKVGKSILKASGYEPSVGAVQLTRPVTTHAAQAAIGEVVERESATSSGHAPCRPVSRFKAARLAAKK
ncbi:hypothetical protein LSTR_LSTR014524 [Laodelphax striatellus]|uniref:Unconventional prefoldin RPB5 interactor n=1 Tax=Laodelphax striatellus TaxID=195883 RepID=A0A482XAY9_LAOST|nr:hypothetical protein LSTR_LSTR014524 [Laodelphax striatellus]